MSEADYLRGYRAACRSLLMTCVGELSMADTSDDDKRLARLGALESERFDTVNALREVTDEFGSTKWDDNLHLGDVVEKHLHRQLRESKESEMPGITTDTPRPRECGHGVDVSEDDEWITKPCTLRYGHVGPHITNMGTLKRSHVSVGLTCGDVAPAGAGRIACELSGGHSGAHRNQGACWGAPGPTTDGHNFLNFGAHDRCQRCDLRFLEAGGVRCVEQLDTVWGAGVEPGKFLSPRFICGKPTFKPQSGSGRLPVACHRDPGHDGPCGIYPTA